MKIAINTRFLLANKLEGIGWFTYEIFKRLAELHPEIEWLFIFDRPYDTKFIFGKNVTPIIANPPARHPILWFYWFEISIPLILKKHKPDLFISPDGYIPLRSSICKTIAVIHDINFEHHPNNIPLKARGYFLRNFKKFAHKATRIATVSQYSQSDIASTYQIDKSKIDLVYNGCSTTFFPISLKKKNAVKENISKGKDYFLFIGALNPRKNLEGMLSAYEIYRNNNGRKKFVIIGEKMYWSKKVQSAYENHPFKSDILWVGRQSEENLNNILASAYALLFVSHFEGFGIPIIEAFQCEVPVITSSTTAMPEIAGDAALICNPKKPKDISSAMLRIEDQKLREDLISKGKIRAAYFTWDRSAEMMWNSIQKTLKT